MILPPIEMNEMSCFVGKYVSYGFLFIVTAAFIIMLFIHCFMFHLRLIRDQIDDILNLEIDVN